MTHQKDNHPNRQDEPKVPPDSIEATHNTSRKDRKKNL